MSRQPNKIPGTRLCLCLTEEGLTVYGNKQSFSALADYMRWIENSDAKEHFECHVKRSLGDDASVFGGKRPRNTWVLMGKDQAKLFQSETENHPGFELTFMMVEERDLDELAKGQDDGILPDH